MRPGEKLFEELLIGDNPQPTQHQRIMKAHEDFLPLPEYMQLLEQLKAAQKVNDVPRMREVIAQLVPGYQPEGGVVDWLYEAQVQAA